MLKFFENILFGRFDKPGYRRLDDILSTMTPVGQVVPDVPLPTVPDVYKVYEVNDELLAFVRRLGLQRDRCHFGDGPEPQVGDFFFLHYLDDIVLLERANIFQPTLSSEYDVEFHSQKQAA